MSVKMIRELCMKTKTKPKPKNSLEVDIPILSTPKYSTEDCSTIDNANKLDTSDFEIKEVEQHKSQKFTEKVVYDYNITFDSTINTEEKDAINKLITAIRHLSTISYKELEAMYENNKPPRFDLPKIEKKLAVISVDPAPLTFGIALCLLSTTEPVAVDIRAFREEYEQPDLGKKALLMRIKQYVDCINCSYIFWVIEDQIAGKLERAKFEKTFTTFGEAQTVQYFAMGILGDNIQVVAPKSVKEYFNIGLDESISGKIITQEQKKKQYYHNKATATKIALGMTPENIRKDIRLLTNRDDPNIYDAILNAKYYIRRLKGLPSVREKEKNDTRVSKNGFLKKAKIEESELDFEF